MLTIERDDKDKVPFFLACFHREKLNKPFAMFRIYCVKNFILLAILWQWRSEQ